MPYTKDANGHTWFLLGREKPNVNWGIDSGSWSEFGGSLDPGESPEEGAAREFFEESMGTIFGSRQWMENELKQGRYLLVMDSKTPSGKGYRTFVKYLPLADYPKRFARFRTLAKKQPEIFSALAPPGLFHTAGSRGQLGAVKHTCTEKTCMAWFSVRQMKDAVEKYKKAQHPPKLSRAGQPNKYYYFEPGRVPHIRRGFAMDFDHLMNTTWGKNEFQNDIQHFPREPVAVEIICTTSGTLRPVVTTPRARLQASTAAGGGGGHNAWSRPPMIKVNTEGYSFKKKQRKRRRRRPTVSVASPSPPGLQPSPPRTKWKTVTTRKSQKRQLKRENRTSYRPVPPTF